MSIGRRNEGAELSTNAQNKKRTTEKDGSVTLADNTNKKQYPRTATKSSHKKGMHDGTPLRS
ncbi:hypothetical protein GCM10007086_08450 [Photobacterium aphoticum]|nr:hypothetical protein GCM10007086_08450 [Photobacterium aphoticum]